MKLRFLFTLFIALVSATGSASQVPLADRLSAIDKLNQSFQVVGLELQKVEEELRASAYCREPGPKPLKIIEKCLRESDPQLWKAIEAALSKYSELLAIQSTLANSSPEQMKSRIESTNLVFIALSEFSKKLFLARLHLAIDKSPFVNRPLVNPPTPQPWKPLRPSVSRSLFETRVKISEFETVEISPGESKHPGREDGNCIGRRCGDSDSPSHGERSGEGRSRGERAFERADYKGSEVRAWTAAGAPAEARPYPISDDHIVAIEHENSEKEVHEKFDPIIHAVSGPIRAAWDKFAPVDYRDVYEVKSEEPSQQNDPKEISVGTLSNRAMIVGSRLSNSQPKTQTQSEAKALGIAAIGIARRDLMSKRLDEASAMLDVAEGMADIALGVTPGVGWAKDVYEAVTGTNLVSGAKLDTFDRSLAIFGAVSLGLGSKAGTAAKALDKLTDLAKALGHAIGNFPAARKLAHSALRIGLKTKEQAQELYDFSRRTFGNDIGAIGDNLSDLIDAFGDLTFGKIWSTGKQRNALENALEHVEDHIKEFPELKTRVDYIRATWNFIKNPPAGTAIKLRSNGEKIFYQESTNTFAAITEEGIPKTMFKPEEGFAYWDRQRGQILQ